MQCVQKSFEGIKKFECEKKDVSKLEYLEH